MTGVGGLVGLLFGVGLYLVVVAFGPVRARKYVLRMQHFAQPTPRTRDRVAWLGSDRRERIGRRQELAGRAVDPAAHLLSIVTSCSAGLAIGAAVLALLTASGSVRQPTAALPLLAICVVSGWLVADRQLDTAVKRRREHAVMELPATAESLAIAVSAGAALPHACELVATQSQGVLADELSRVVAAVGAGSTIDRALAEMATRLPSSAIGRFIDAMRIALERGTPIVDVLHAQAADARDESRRLLMEKAGRREVAMLIPVVFCVLPAVVVVALYPGFRELTSMV